MDTREQLLESLHRAFDGRSWHGPNLLGAIRGLTPAQAFFRPGPGRHSVYDLILHAAYWKYVARRRLTGEKRGSFPVNGSNFFPEPASKDARAVRDARTLLESMHLELVQVVEALPDAAFSTQHGPWTAGEMIAGVAAHDLYHAGQIQLVKRFFGKRRAR
ncbi:MAG TPA: DinB family protein [Thermoanaerobaculia bacterium]|nr:DinB family protein [Thermoanaerobaculia bacterium]